MYKLNKKLDSEMNVVPPQSVTRLSDTAIVPFDPANTDYQEFLKWLAEGNEPLPADEV